MTKTYVSSVNIDMGLTRMLNNNGCFKSKMAQPQNRKYRYLGLHACKQWNSNGYTHSAGLFGNMTKLNQHSDVMVSYKSNIAVCYGI